VQGDGLAPVSYKHLRITQDQLNDSPRPVPNGSDWPSGVINVMIGSETFIPVGFPSRQFTVSIQEPVNSKYSLALVNKTLITVFNAAVWLDNVY
jgi:hypothetical protein